MFQRNKGPGFFNLDIDPNSTPEMLDNQRALITSLMGGMGRAQSTGEGLGQLATGIVAGIQRRKMNEFQGGKHEEASDLFSRISNSFSNPPQQPLSLFDFGQNSQVASPSNPEKKPDPKKVKGPFPGFFGGGWGRK
ncbi:hypothetical protein [Sulfitobacter pontiacus]|uniref:hypothetical protein n=1 Tax=Sulfitobacter pontiacus TaxID=60137 RepID=UPI00315A0CB4